MSHSVLIFDFDGTIADTHHYICEISNRLSREFNYNFIDLDELEKLKDRTSQEIIRYLKVPVMKIPAILTKAKEEFQKGIDTIEPIKGLKEILLQMKKDNVKMGILSSNSNENIMTFLKDHGLDIFDFIHSTSKVWSKNTALKKVISSNGLTNDDVLYIGDEIRDITAAKKLGIKIAAVTWGYNSQKALKKHRPDFIINNPEELLRLCSPEAATL